MVDVMPGLGEGGGDVGLGCPRASCDGDGRATRRQHGAQHSRLGLDMETDADRQAFERTCRRKLAPDVSQHRHVRARPGDLLSS